MLNPIVSTEQYLSMSFGPSSTPAANSIMKASGFRYDPISHGNIVFEGDMVTKVKEEDEFVGFFVLYSVYLTIYLAWNSRCPCICIYLSMAVGIQEKGPNHILGADWPTGPHS